MSTGGAVAPVATPKAGLLDVNEKSSAPKLLYIVEALALRTLVLSIVYPLFDSTTEPPLITLWSITTLLADEKLGSS